MSRLITPGTLTGAKVPPNPRVWRANRPAYWSSERKGQTVSISEIARLKVKSAQRATFVEEARTFAKILASDRGCHHVEMLQGVEDPDSFVFVITWDSREAHKTFQGSGRGRQAISTIGSYLVEPPRTSHYESPGRGRETLCPQVNP